MRCWKVEIAHRKNILGLWFAFTSAKIKFPHKIVNAFVRSTIYYVHPEIFEAYHTKISRYCIYRNAFLFIRKYL